MLHSENAFLIYILNVLFSFAYEQLIWARTRQELHVTLNIVMSIIRTCEPHSDARLKSVTVSEYVSKSRYPVRLLFDP